MKCLECQVEKLEKDFRLHKNKYRLKTCRKCENKKGKERWKKRRDKIKQQIKDMKLNKGCCICSWSQHQYGLDLHHINPNNKSFDISTVLTRSGATSIKQIKKEIEKCCVICSNCHRGLHNGVVKLPQNVKPCSLD